MAGFTISEWVAVDPGTAFDELIGTKNAAEIMDNFVSMEQITEGEIGIGTRFRETRLMNGKEATSELEVTGFERPAYYAVGNVTQGIFTTYHYRVSAENSGTRITLDAEVTSSGLKKLIVPIVVRILKKEDGEHLTKLKQVIESRLQSE